MSQFSFALTTEGLSSSFVQIYVLLFMMLKESILKYETFCRSESRGGHKHDQRLEHLCSGQAETAGAAQSGEEEASLRLRAPSTILKGLQESWGETSDKGMECDWTRGNGLNCQREGLD